MEWIASAFEADLEKTQALTSYAVEGRNKARETEEIVDEID